MARQTTEGADRTWKDWLNIVLGILIMLAPWIADETSNQQAVINAALAGLAILMLAEFDIVAVRSWAEAGQIAAGVWVAISPLVFGYSAEGMLRYWHLIAGGLVALLGALELFQSKGPAGR